MQNNTPPAPAAAGVHHRRNNHQQHQQQQHGGSTLGGIETSQNLTNASSHRRRRRTTTDARNNSPYGTDTTHDTTMKSNINSHKKTNQQGPDSKEGRGFWSYFHWRRRRGGRHSHDTSKRRTSIGNTDGGEEEDSSIGSDTLLPKTYQHNSRSNRMLKPSPTTRACLNINNSFLLGGVDKRRYRKKPKSLLYRMCWSSVPRRVCVSFTFLYLLVFHVLVPGIAVLWWGLLEISPTILTTTNSGSSLSGEALLARLQGTTTAALPSIRDEQLQVQHLEQERARLRRSETTIQKNNNSTTTNLKSIGTQRLSVLEQIVPQWYHRNDISSRTTTDHPRSSTLSQKNKNQETNTTKKKDNDNKDKNEKKKKKQEQKKENNNHDIQHMQANPKDETISSTDDEDIDDAVPDHILNKHPQLQQQEEKEEKHPILEKVNPNKEKAGPKSTTKKEHAPAFTSRDGTGIAKNSTHTHTHISSQTQQQQRRLRYQQRVSPHNKRVLQVMGGTAAATLDANLNLNPTPNHPNPDRHHEEKDIGDSYRHSDKNNASTTSTNTMLLPVRTIHNQEELAARYSSCDVRPPQSTTTMFDANSTTTTTTATALIATTLVVQTSIDRMWILKETCRRWNTDPIIAVVFVPHPRDADNHDDNDYEPILKRNTEYLFDNDNSTASTTTTTRKKSSSYGCTNNLRIVWYRGDPTESIASRYPVNRMRNVGLDLVATSHVLMIDVDFVPSQNLDTVIQNAVIDNNKKTKKKKKKQKSTDRSLHTALIVPAFERKAPIDCTNDASCSKYLRKDSNFLPHTYEEIQTCFKNKKDSTNSGSNIDGAKKKKSVNHGQCVVFQSEYNWEGHSTTRSKKWINEEFYDDTDTNSFRKISCFDTARYEPYVVLEWCPLRSATNEVHDGQEADKEEQAAGQDDQQQPISPYYDERFYGYGKNKIELISHLRMSGQYEFRVLPKGFIVHNPHPESKTKRTWNDTVNSTLHSAMDKLYVKFMKELYNMYYASSSSSLSKTNNNVVQLCNNK